MLQHVRERQQQRVSECVSERASQWVSVSRDVLLLLLLLVCDQVDVITRDIILQSYDMLVSSHFPLKITEH